MEKLWIVIRSYTEGEDFVQKKHYKVFTHHFFAEGYMKKYREEHPYQEVNFELKSVTLCEALEIALNQLNEN